MKLKLVFSKLYNQMTHLPEKHMSKVSENINRTLYMKQNTDFQEGISQA